MATFSDASKPSAASVTVTVKVVLVAPTAIVTWPAGEARRMVLHLAIALTAYILLMSFVGFALSTFLFVLGAVRAWRRYSLWASAAYAVGVTTLLQLTFRVALGMPLPHGLLGYF